MDWYPQLFTAEQAAAVSFVFKAHLFQKGVFGDPQAMFTAGHAAAGVFFFSKQ